MICYLYVVLHQASKDSRLSDCICDVRNKQQCPLRYTPPRHYRDLINGWEAVYMRLAESIALILRCILSATPIARRWQPSRCGLLYRGEPGVFSWTEVSTSISTTWQVICLCRYQGAWVTLTDKSSGTTSCAVSQCFPRAERGRHNVISAGSFP
ncbi:uncharacterized protein BDW43DRAFT_294684 [Aspergillus alliaceus]|uniref:uncharacterized protein n=1 Tax=Petromyces alliaceus TaxID=209559 RepID=UPI0012A6D93E|nr:uncharacterized protein BDW43DRAFT_294684 [Aspergillus alliaceus]KAB8227214.1 hypothetical protein BDW43DRAFT_294684 [Aspergillus alliaceus]